MLGDDYDAAGEEYHGSGVLPTCCAVRALLGLGGGGGGGVGDYEQVAGYACFYSRPVEWELETVSGGAGRSSMGGRDMSHKSLMQATLHGRALRQCLGTRDD